MGSKEFIHWPEFDKLLCGQMTDRERLGLPDHFIENRFSAGIEAAIEEIRGLSHQQLVDIVGDKLAPLTSRYAAGNMLALLGDPRISTFDPQMIDIPGGAVSIGLDEQKVPEVLRQFDKLGLSESWIKKECPRHQVWLSPFRIAKYPITNHEYRIFLADTHYSELPDSWTFRRFPVERANHPVYTLSPAACDAYAAWLSEHTGRHFRLPTEAEWEFAASGQGGLEFPWGETFHANFANTCETGIFNTTPVGIFSEGASPFGVMDMAGNVEEYVADQYRPYPGGENIDDHLSQIHGDYRVARGGSFARFRDLARNARRHGHNPRSTTYAMGFRLAESI
jgi:formylglycine-generating enzyme required for sulfatase activity